MLATGALTLIFGLKETSDFWVDGLLLWWQQQGCILEGLQRLVIYLDNGPHNSGGADTILEAVGAICGCDGDGNSSGVLSALS